MSFFENEISKHTSTTENLAKFLKNENLKLCEQLTERSTDLIAYMQSVDADEYLLSKLKQLKMAVDKHQVLMKGLSEKLEINIEQTPALPNLPHYEQTSTTQN